jgi:lysophospholipase L1-like esterase
MSGEGRFPLRAVFGLGLAWLLGTIASNAVGFDPTSELPAVSTPGAPPPALGRAGDKRAPGELRVVAVGSSLTAGYPYPAGCGYADLMQHGLAALHPERRIIAVSYAKPALDSTGLADMVDRLVRDHDPSLICVELGSNELANRIFGGRPLLPRHPLAWLHDRASRARQLFRLLPETKGGKQQELEKQLELWVLDSKHGEPHFDALPVSADEQQLLVERLRRSMRRISEAGRAAQVPVVFLVTCYGLGGAWPWGLSAGGLQREVDALVERTWKGLDPGLLPETERLLARWPQRADLHFVHGLLLRARGETAARAAFERARDLDQAALHLTGPIQAAIEAEAAALGRPCLSLDAPFVARARDGIPGPEHYLDYGHLDLEGHFLAAEFLTDRLAGLGLLPALPDAWQERFSAAVRAAAGALRARLDPALAAFYFDQAPANIANADAGFSMLFGNYREAVPYTKHAVRVHVWRRDVAARFLYCVYGYAGLTDELVGGAPAERAARALRLHDEVKAAVDAGKLDEWVDAVLARRPR